jgi:hypothetical protein
MSIAEPLGLFDEPERVGVPDAAGRPEGMTEGEWRRARHAAAIVRGQHPLSVALGTPLPLHPEAAREFGPPSDGTPRCGSCDHRERMPGGNRSFPKCLAGAYVTRHAPTHWEKRAGTRIGPDGLVAETRYPRATHGAGTDVRRDWPACVDYYRAGSAGSGTVVPPG